MNILDDQNRVNRLDPNNALGSVGMLGEQLAQVFKEFKDIKLPASFKGIDKIVHNGMGGSALGADIIGAIYFEELKKPFQVVRGYDIPATVDAKTLFIACSYSGTTEEVIAGIEKAKKRGAKIFGIASGGKVGEMVKQGKIAGYVFDPVANPSGQPRIGVGYTLAAELALLKKLGFINLNEAEINKNLKLLDNFNNRFAFQLPASKNKAKQIAQQIKGKALLITAAGHLAGNAHVFANQTNETGKTLAAYHLVSELNHHLLEGLRFPAANRSQLLFIFLESSLYHAKDQLRFKITKDVVVKNKIKQLSYQLTSSTKLGQALEALSLSSYITFYLAMINNVNPNLIPWVDYFKNQLKK